MSRLLSFKAVRRFGTLSSINSSASNSVSRCHDKFTTLRHPFPLWGMYSRQKIYSRGCFNSAAYATKENLMKGNFCRNILSGSLITQHARHAWKNIFRVSRDTDPLFSAVSKMAGAVSFSCTRSYLIPGIFALLAGEVALFERASADSEQSPVTKSLYMSAQDGHMFVTSIFLSVVEGFILLLRSAYLSILFTPAMLMAPFADSCGPKFRKAWLHVVRLTLETAGPAFIKWGQWAATRPDLFPGDLCTELTKLHSKAPAHSFEYSKRTIEKAFGRVLSEIFESFDEEPVASGSVAQVHRASLTYQFPKQKGKLLTVAVKVRHPGVGESIRRDFAIINVVAKISSCLPALKWLRLDESVQQFAVFMMSQVDLSREAAHLSRFIYNFRGWKNVSFPKPLYPFVHPAVLVETFEHGESVAYYLDSLKGNDRIKSDLARIGTHALLKMLLVDNFVHADMHPGNILVRIPKTKGSRKSKPHVVLIDVGMTAELSQSDRSNLVDFFKAVALRDGRRAANCALKLSKQQNCPNPEAFIEEVEKSFTFWGTPEGDVVHPADCMHQLLEQVRRHQVNIDGNVCTVMVTTLVLEGWQRKLDPGYDIMRTLQTMLFRKDWAQSLTYTIEGLMAP